LEELTAQLKQNNANFYTLATTLQGDTSLKHLLLINTIDAIASEELYEVLNEVLTEPDQPISKLLEVSENIEPHREILFVDNKTRARFSNNFGDHGRNAEMNWRLALSYLYFTPGVPMLYQGSEIPMYGPGYPENQYIVDFISADPEVKK